MKEFSFKSLSLTKTVLAVVISFAIVFTSTLTVRTYTGSAILSLVCFAVLAIVCCQIAKNLIFEDVHIIVNDSCELIISQHKHNLEAIVTYSFDRTEYLEKCMLKFSTRSHRFYVFKKSEDYLNFKNWIKQQINEINSFRNEKDKIKIKNFYNSKYSKLYGWILISLLIIWTGAMIAFPEKSSFRNFAIFLVFISGIIPVLLRIFHTKR